MYGSCQLKVSIFKEENILLLINEEATYAAIRNALFTFLKSPTDDDVVVVYFAGHGTPDRDRLQNHYLLTHDYRAEEVKVTLAKIRRMVAEKRGVAPEEIDMSNVEAFYILEGSYVDGSLEQAVADYGSMDAYIREGLGISDDEIEMLKSQLLE